MSGLRLILASASPRRRALLEQLGLSFSIAAADVDESVRPFEAAARYVERLAVEKAKVIAEREPGAVVLAADTSVVLGAEILGKPGADEEAGRRMLSALSGRTHEVMTGVAVAFGDQVRTQVVVTQVTFRALSAAEIAWYVATGEGQDKAGGYASQARAGAFISRLDGSSTSVIGLPLAESLALLRDAGLTLPWDALSGS